MPTTPLTARQGGASATNGTAFLAIGGTDGNGLQSGISLAFTALSGALAETLGLANISFDRAASAAHPSDGSVYLFGGLGATGFETNSLWRIATATGGAPPQPALITPAGASPRPPARKLAGMAYLSPCPAMAGACLVLLGGDTQGALLGDVWVFDLTALVWSQPLGSNVGMPSPRSAFSVVASPDNSQLFVFGGLTAAGVSNDLFALAPFGFADAQPSEMTNLAAATGVSAAISSLDPSLGTRGAGAAIDGNIVTRFTETVAGVPSTCNCNFCTMTALGSGTVGSLATAYCATCGTSNPWWGVDLQSSQKIDFIYVYMRTPTASGQYTYDWPFGKQAGAAIFASTTNLTAASPCPSTGVYAPGTAACPYTSVGSGGCGAGTHAVAGGGCAIDAPVGAEIPVGGPTIYSTAGLNARFLWIVLPGYYRILSLCEFQAWQKKPWVWRKLTGTFNAALASNGAVASQSSTLSGWGDGEAYRAIDGIVSNNLDNAQPYTVSSTRDGGDTPFTWWQVDFGKDVAAQSINVFGRGEGCCTGRNANTAWYIGDSQDYHYNTKCTLAPASFSPPCYQTAVATCQTNPNCYAYGYTGLSASASTCSGTVPGCPLISYVIGMPNTACFVTFKCPVQGRYLQAIKATTDTTAISFGEVQVVANTMLNLPSARMGMSAAAYGGNLVVFGGQDVTGFRLNEVRFFDMLLNAWLPPFTPIGTTPTARSLAFFGLLPPTVAGSPSSKFALAGGYGNSNILADVNTLSLPQCAPFSQLGVQSMTCAQGGTVCYVTCAPYATSSNGAAPLVCQVTGAWRGILPACNVQVASAPTVTSASVNSQGIATVAWSAPTNFGYFSVPSSVDQYRVSITPPEVYESFASNAFPAPIAPFGVSPTANTLASTYIGGNWWRLTEKQNLNTVIPFPLTGYGPTGAGCTLTTNTACGPSNTATFTLGVSNTWDFWNGYLRLDSDYYRFTKYDQNDAMTVFRDFPASVNPAQGWEMETFVSLDVSNIVTATQHSACIGLLDTSDYCNMDGITGCGMGVIEFYACIFNNGGQQYNIFQQSSTNAWAQNLYDASIFQTAYTKPYAAYLRYTYNPANFPYSFRAAFKFNQGDAWTDFPDPANDLVLRGGPVLPQNMRPALIMRNANTAYVRGVGLFSYFRLGPLNCVDAGAQRFVPGATTSALIYGLTQGSAYSFQVQAHTAAGWGAVSAPSASVVVPVLPAPVVLPLLSQGNPCTMNSYASATTNLCGWALDGSTATYSQNNGDAGVYGSWLQVDLGSVRTVNSVTVVARQDLYQAYLNNFEVWVSTGITFMAPAQGGSGAQCDPAAYNSQISSVAGYAQSFPCYAVGTKTLLAGRYVTIRRQFGAAVLPLMVAELQVYGTAATPLVSQGQPCTMSSVSGISGCTMALDGNPQTFAQNNNDAPLYGNPFGWLTVDLGVPTVVSRVALVARPDTAATVRTLDNLVFYLGDAASFYSAATNLYANPQCNASFVPKTLFGLANSTATFACVENDGLGWASAQPAIGRYLTLQTRATASFSVAELRVFAANAVLASFNKPCFMSTTSGAFVCQNAFNGIISDYASTTGDIDNFITVDLGLSTAVAYIKVTARTDCCGANSNNPYFFVGDSSNYHQNVPCPAAGIVPSLFTAAQGWQMTFACALTGRYVTMHIASSASYQLQVAEVQVFAANACPDLDATGATQLAGSVCSGAGYGQVCTYVCNQGFVAVTGATSNTCNGAAWTSPALVCQPVCPDLPAPQYADSCSQSYFMENFNLDGALSRFMSLQPYTAKLAIPSGAPPQLTKWFTYDGFLQSSSLVACTADLHLAISSAKIFAYPSTFTLSARINTASQAGLIWRMQDNANGMRFFYNAAMGQAQVQRLVAGLPVTLSSATSPYLTPNVWHVVSVTVQGSAINVTFDGALLISTLDNTYQVGYAGVYAQSSALFDDLSHTADCTDCTGMTNNDQCTFSCQAGLIAQGPVTRVCTGTSSIATMAYAPDATASPLYCTLAAPTFLPTALYVAENSAANAPVGAPLVAFTTNPNYQVQYQILAVYAMVAYLTPAFQAVVVPNQALFWVDVCSGQVKLRTGGKDVMNYEIVNTYVLTVNVFVAGFVNASTTANVTVYVTNVDEPPLVLPTSLTVAENAANTLASQTVVWAPSGGAAVGAPTEWDPENSTVVYSLSVDGGAGRFSLNATTGAITVAKTAANASATALNFEVQPNTFVLSVTATQSNNPTLFSTGSISVSVVNANDPPVISAGQVFSLSEYTSSNNPTSVTYPVLAGVVAAVDEDNLAPSPSNPTWSGSPSCKCPSLPHPALPRPASAPPCPAPPC